MSVSLRELATIPTDLAMVPSNPRHIGNRCSMCDEKEESVSRPSLERYCDILI